MLYHPHLDGLEHDGVEGEELAADGAVVLLGLLIELVGTVARLGLRVFLDEELLGEAGEVVARVVEVEKARDLH